MHHGAKTRKNIRGPKTHLAQGGSPVGNLVGYFVGHLYYFLKENYPPTRDNAVFFPPQVGQAIFRAFSRNPLPPPLLKQFDCLLTRCEIGLESLGFRVEEFGLIKDILILFDFLLARVHTSWSTRGLELVTEAS